MGVREPLPLRPLSGLAVSARMTDPMDLHRDLAAVLADLELIEAFERTARYGSALRGWVSDADGSRDTATREAEVERLVELVFERDGEGALRPRQLSAEHPQYRAVAEARSRLVSALEGGPLRSIERDEEDRDWSHTIAQQRRLRALGSHASTAVPAAVLRFMAAQCPRSMSLGDVCDAVAMAFASAVLRDAWERARVEEAAAKISRLRRDGARCGGRPRGTRQRPSPALARAAFGRELVAWAVDVWLARASVQPSRSCLADYLPKPDRQADNAVSAVCVAGTTISGA